MQKCVSEDFPSAKCACAGCSYKLPRVHYHLKSKGSPPQHTTAIIFTMEIKLMCSPLLYLCLPLSTSSISCSPSPFLSPPTQLLRTFNSWVECELCLLPPFLSLSSFFSSLCRCAMLQQAGQQPPASICVRFVYARQWRGKLFDYTGFLESIYRGKKRHVLLLITSGEWHADTHPYIIYYIHFVCIVLAQCK